MMHARQNRDGVSINESSVCINCLYDSDTLHASYEAWRDAEDTDEDTDDTIYPSDNCDGVCVGCGNHYEEWEK